MAIQDAGWRANTLADVAAAMAAAEQTDYALEAAGRIEDDAWRTEAMIRIAEALLRARQFGQG
ncbi:MAG TPA: hypothetical protein VNV86_09050, partial [Candidatus Acidoferrum sp.]|nr:hypothetical protein [Candidatus Acidoferrum sp.]